VIQNEFGENPHVNRGNGLKTEQKLPQKKIDAIYVNQRQKKASAALASATRGARRTDVIRVNQHRERKTSAALASAPCLHGTPSPPAGFEPLTHLQPVRLAGG
jgi:hypothetical protein